MAELYAQVQAMPESAQKKRLITKLNDANGYGTPKIRKPFISKTPHNNVAETLENFKSWITPRQKRTASTVSTGSALQKGTKKEKPIGRSGSYSLRQKKHSEMITLDEQTAPHSFKRCISEPQDGSNINPNKIHPKEMLPAYSLRSHKDIITIQSETQENTQDTYLAGSKKGETEPNTFNLPPPKLVPTDSVQKRAPPPIPLRVSSLKPKIDTPQSPNCALSTNYATNIGIVVTPCVSSTPLPTGI